jgi:hypothetical protein
LHLHERKDEGTAGWEGKGVGNDLSIADYGYFWLPILD